MTASNIAFLPFWRRLFFIYSEAGFVWQEIFCLKFYILLPRLQCSGKQSFMLIHHHPWIGSLSWMEDRHKLTVFYLKMLPRIQCKHLNRSPGRNLHSPSSSLSPSARKRPRAGILRHGFLTCGISLDEHYKAREKFFFGGWLDSWGKGGGPGRACKIYTVNRRVNIVSGQTLHKKFCTWFNFNVWNYFGNHCENLRDQTFYIFLRNSASRFN